MHPKLTKWSNQQAMLVLMLVGLSVGADVPDLPGLTPGARPLPLGLEASTRARAAAADPSLEEVRLDRALADAQATTQRWQIAWWGIFGAQVGVNVGLGLGLGDDQFRDSQLVRAGPPAVGALAGVLIPPRALRAKARAHALDLRLRDDGHRIAAKRALLRELAADERRLNGWFPRIAGLVLNLGAAAALWAINDDPLPAGIQVGVGTLLNELKIQTAPRTARVYVRRASVDGW
jgi:hypothetical protein